MTGMTPYERHQEWLSGLTVGDEVALPLSVFGPQYDKYVHKVLEIDRMTPTQLVVLHAGMQFRIRRKDGGVIGHRFRHVAQPGDRGNIELGPLCSISHGLTAHFEWGWARTSIAVKPA